MTTATPARATVAAGPPPYSPGRAALAGLLAGWVALGLGELLGQGLPGARSPLVAVGDGVIRLVPPVVKDVAIAWLGTADKPALILGTLVLLAVLAHRLGIAAARRPVVGDVGVAVVAAGSLLAQASAGSRALPAVLIALTQAAGGITVLHALLPVPRLDAVSGPAGGLDGGLNGRLDRRRLLVGTVAATVVGAAAVGGARVLMARASAAVEAVRARLNLPTVAAPLPAVPAAVDLGTRGVEPWLTPNADFYRIDTAISVPVVDPATWQLSVRGLVDRPFTLTYAELLALPQVEADITISCVSNEVGGPLVGTARWQGVRLADLLERAGVQAGGVQLVGRSVDDFTVGFPTALALDGRDALVAIGMNGEPLPLRHGFPARLVVPGLYGYVSATKWLSSLELTTESFDAFWVPRGWAKEAPIKLTSRFDTPLDGASVAAGPVELGGYAWAPHTGVALVEVRVDDGPWQRARLGAAAGRDTWRQWAWTWTAVPGEHVLQVRAADATGALQVERRQEPRPDGATGWHTVGVQVA